MKKAIPILLMILLPAFGATGYGTTMNYSVGIYGGFMPSMGGNLNSSVQEQNFNTRNGIDGINKTSSGINTSTIERLFGVTGGIEIKGVFYDYFFARLAANYTRSVYGGTGKTVWDTPAGGFTPESLKCTYIMTAYDVPFTVGLSIPFWQDVKISFSCGLAFAYGIYENKFESATTAIPPGGTKSEGGFKGYTFPLVLMVQGEYFLTDVITLTSSLVYYKGATDTIKDEKKSDGIVDFAPIDFTGYRFSLGVSYYFYSK